MKRHIIVTFLIVLSGCASQYISRFENSNFHKCEWIPFWKKPSKEDIPYNEKDHNGKSCYQVAKEKKIELDKISKSKNNISRIKNIKKYVQNYPQYKKFENAAINRTYKIGMPEYLLLMAAGNRISGPARTTTTSFGKSTQYSFKGRWFLNKTNRDLIYIYVDDGIVTAIQD